MLMSRYPSIGRPISQQNIAVLFEVVRGPTVGNLTTFFTLFSNTTTDTRAGNNEGSISLTVDRRADLKTTLYVLSPSPSPPPPPLSLSLPPPSLSLSLRVFLKPLGFVFVYCSNTVFLCVSGRIFSRDEVMYGDAQVSVSTFSPFLLLHLSLAGIIISYVHAGKKVSK